MGARQTKIEGCYLPDTPPNLKYQSNNDQFVVQRRVEIANPIPEKVMDPRSPTVNVCRTPINIHYSHTKDTVELYKQHETPINSSENPFEMLRKRFFKFTYNLNDPRSPSSQVTRTPLIFDDQRDRTLNLNDTFSDLFVESRAPSAQQDVTKYSTLPEEVEEQVDDMHMDENTVNHSKENLFLDNSLNGNTKANDESSCQVQSLIYEEEEETMACPAILQKTPPILVPQQQQVDPRSPTFGVDRTPIIFSDDDEVSEDAMLESILATLSLNMSNNSSIVSFGEISNSLSNNDSTTVEYANAIKPNNKHLDRVRIACSNKSRPMRRVAACKAQRQRIYEDIENMSQSSTTKQSTNSSLGSPATKRTPLSCVKNRSHLRSRSVEMSAKSIKARLLPLTSYDDNLNPVQNSKVANLRIMQDSQDSFEIDSY